MLKWLLTVIVAGAIGCWVTIWLVSEAVTLAILAVPMSLTQALVGG